MTYTTFRISKLDAAKRQLNQAIRLRIIFFDYVSSYTLASAAAGILIDLANKKTEKALMEAFFDRIKPQKKSEVRKAFSKTKNFFKHADRDSDTIYEFIIESTDFEIGLAIHEWSHLGNELTNEMNIFWQWIAYKYPNLYEDSFLINQIKSLRKTFTDDQQLELEVLNFLKQKLTN